MRKILCFVSVFSLFFHIPSWGQKCLTVIDITDGKPVPYVNICFNGGWEYSNDNGEFFLTDTVSSITTSHISYKDQNVNVNEIEDGVIRLTPLISSLPPAVVLPDSYHKKRIGHSSDKCAVMQGGKNGYTIAEFFSAEDFGDKMPVLTDIVLNINPFVLNKTFTATEGEQTIDNCVTHIAKLRVDVRSVSGNNGEPGESLIGGGIIYNSKDRTNLKTHKLVDVPLETPQVFPEDGLFVVVEWIVTDEVGKHDYVTPGIWCTQSQEIETSWDKWPVGTSWKHVNEGKSPQNSKTFCIGLVTRGA